MNVELYVDGRAYTNHSLPGTIVGRTTLYHRCDVACWQGMEARTRERLRNPSFSVQDTTNYLEGSN